MDIIQYAAKPESYDRLSASQIWNFFQKHEAITKDECDRLAAHLLNSPVSPTPVQGATSYTIAADQAPKVVQFRTKELDAELIELARQSYRGFVPSCEARGMFETAHVYVWDFVRGSAFCRVRHQLLALGTEQRLQQTVQDFARCVELSPTYLSCFLINQKKKKNRFFASAWINRPAVKQPPGLFDEYSQSLDRLSQSLPERFHPKLDEVRQGLPLLFRSEYPMVVQHDDLLENNIHVDEATGRITGIVDWHDAIIALFGVSIAGLETVLGIQTGTSWHLHHSHVSFREQFWDTFYGETGGFSEADRRSVEIARLFGLFRSHGPEENAAAYLDVLCPL